MGICRRGAIFEAGFMARFLFMESILKTELELKALELCEQHLSSKGYRVVDLDCYPAKRSILRVFIEPQSTQGVSTSLEDCVRVTSWLGDALEKASFFSGQYELEVSSPGLDRRLRVRSDFQKVVGSELQLKLVQKGENHGMNLKGVLEDVDNGDIILSASGRKLKLGLGNIKRANVVWHF